MTVEEDYSVTILTNATHKDYLEDFLIEYSETNSVGVESLRTETQNITIIFKDECGFVSNSTIAPFTIYNMETSVQRATTEFSGAASN